MPPYTDPRPVLTKITLQWDGKTPHDSRDSYNYTRVLRELLFHARLRFSEYVQFQNQEGLFGARLLKWLNNVEKEREQQSLLKLAERVEFVDQHQMRSLYRDAYRRIIVPWLTSCESVSTLLAPDYEMKVMELLREYRLYSITESFKSAEFTNWNSLVGLRKFDVLTEDPLEAARRIPDQSTGLKGLIILEDFVGTGKQSSSVLQTIAELRPNWRILFIPLIMVGSVDDSPLAALAAASAVAVYPVTVVDGSACLRDVPSPEEPEEFAYIRAVVKSTGDRVKRRLNTRDAPPDNEFGYRGQGAMIVTHHNTPNNTLPLIHHKAPQWNPLFRRVHHSKDGL